MKIVTKLLCLAILELLLAMQLPAQLKYRDFKTLSADIQSLASRYQSLCTYKSLAKTHDGKDIWVLTIGTGDKEQKPGVAVFGTVEGNYIAGREMALGFAENILTDSESADVKNLLENLTFYVFPDIAPDAAEQYFAQLKYERKVNSGSTDDDRDFQTDEDPYEDLNNDGLITLIRILDPTGTYIESSDDKRIMTVADISKGQTGAYLVFSEGIDNDKDGKFNEDGPGGVNANRNFTYNFEEYGLNTGYHAMSEPETKAVADFLFDHFNIYMTIAFGPQDNLDQPMKESERQNDPVLADPFEAGRGFMGGSGRGFSREPADRRLTSITKKDAVINKLASDKYHEITGAKGSPQPSQAPGNFMEWAYFHYGRYSFSTPGWWIAADKGKSAEASFLAFAGKKQLPDVFIPWTEIKHPDFPGKKAEVGGIRPFVMYTPPADTLKDVVLANYKFIKALADMHPELEFLDMKTENAGENIFRVTLKVHNKGVFATMAETGLTNQWTRLMKITAEPGKGQTIISGQKIQRMQRLDGGASAEFSWLVSGKGTLAITAGAVNTGIIRTNIDVK